MRKIFSLGLLALFLSLLSTQVIAGKFEACEDPFKATYQDLGIYGLCNAWHNADTDEERAEFEAKVEEKVGFSAPWVAACPCFSSDHLASAGLLLSPASCADDSSGVSVSYQAPVEDGGGFLIFNASYPLKSCFLSNTTKDSLPSGKFTFNLDEELFEKCFDLVEAAIALDFPSGCDS